MLIIRVDKSTDQSINHSTVNSVYLDAVLVQVDIVSGWAVTCLAEDDQLLEEEHVTQASFASVTDDELGLSQQHALLV